MPEQTLAPASANRIPGDRIRRAAIRSIAKGLPEGTLTNAELASQLGLSEDWIVNRTGIRERRRAAPDVRLADFAAAVGADALTSAGIAAEQLDLVIVGTMTA